MKPKISICLPTYNGADFIAACIEAVQDQTFYEWELIIVDDQSTDDTYNIVKEIALFDDRIRLYKNEKNLGLVGNWNQCLEYAETSWIKYVFQDDMILSNCIEKLYKNCLREGVKVGVCNRRYVMDAEADPGVKNYILNDLIKLDKYKNEDGVFSREEIADIVALHPLLNIFGEPTSLLFHKSLIEDFGSFNDDLSQIVDYDFIVKICSNSGCYWSNEPLNFFRIHGGNQTNINRGDKRSEEKRKKIEYVDAILLLHLFLYSSDYRGLTLKEEHKKIIKDKYQAEMAKGVDQIGTSELEKLLSPYYERYEHLSKDLTSTNSTVNI